MATLQEIYAVSQPQGDLAGRFEAAFIKACWAVVYEGDGVEDHVNRLALAKKVLLSPRPYVEKFYRLILSDGTLQAGFADPEAIEDSAIENAVNGFWTTMAKVEAA